MTSPAAGVDRLDLSLPVDQLTAALVDIPSVSGDEARIADLVENTLSDYPHLHVQRWGNVVVARTDLGRAERVVLAGHLDTVPIADNVPSHWDGDTLYGCGTTDMKSGVAVQLSLAAHVTAPNRDVTYVFYDCEEVEATRNGLGRLVNVHPLWLEADFAVLLEPTDGELEAGCQGTLRYRLHAQGRRAHSARSWRGTNAIHLLGPALDTLRAWPGREVEIDGCHYREGLNAVRIGGGVAGNVITDEAWLDVNFRFAPDRDAQDAADYVASLFPGYRLELQDLSPGALPGLHRPAAAAFVAAVGKKPRAKYGWTDVARFTTLGVPAVNFGPGDPNLAHTREEHVFGPQVLEVEAALRTWLTA